MNSLKGLVRVVIRGVGIKNLFKIYFVILSFNEVNFIKKNSLKLLNILNRIPRRNSVNFKDQRISLPMSFPFEKTINSLSFYLSEIFYIGFLVNGL